jgi:glucose-1-phosphate thymidylyltransferase
MKGLLLAGGHGTRLRPLTSTGNKHMLPIANKPMLLYGLEHLRDAGIYDINIILGPIKEGVVETLGDGTKYGVKITYIDQPDPKGLAHAVQVAEKYLRGEPFVMYLGDNLLKQGVTPLIKQFEEKSCDCVVGVTQVKNPSQFGIVEFKEGKINRLIEKPKKPTSDWALIGVYVFSDKVFEAIRKIKPSWRGELEITDTIQMLLSDGAKVEAQKVVGWWKDTGKPSDLLEANQLVLNDIQAKNDGEVDLQASITNNVRIGIGTNILYHTTIRGPAIIGENCEIGPNTHIGPYTSIGDNVKITNTEIENSIVMNGTCIDCGTKIIDSLIGKNVEVTNSKLDQSRAHTLFLGDSSRVSL